MYFHFRSYFYYYSTFSLFLAIFSADELLVFFTLHSFTHISFLLYISVYISLVSVVTIYLPVLFLFDFPYTVVAISFYHISFFYCVPLFVTVTLFVGDTQVIHRHQCYIGQHVLFVFYFLLCLIVFYLHKASFATIS